MRRPSAWLHVALECSLFIAYTSPTWAIGGAESMDRPSARALSKPEYMPETTPEGFSLPPLPDSEPSSKHRIAESRRLFVKRIIVDGNTVLSEEDLRNLLQPYVGREVSVAELEELRQKLTRNYIDQGYVNSGAIIPPDAYVDGVLHYKIVEGRLEDVRVKGQGRLREGYIRNRLLGDPEHPLNLHDLQDRFQVLLSDPLISGMNGRLLPGSSPGHGILDVEVSRARPYQLSVFGDNYRPPSIGAEAFGVSGWVRNLTGLGDALDFTFITGDGSDRYFGGLTVPLTDWGTLAFFRFDEGDSVVVEQPVDDLDIKSQVHNLEGGISHPIINTLRQRLTLGVLLAVRENETSILGQPFSFVPGETTGRNKATVWRLFQEYLQRWDRHAVAFRSTFSVGMNALGATPERDPRFPDSEFFAWLGQGQYAYLVTDDGAQLVLRGVAQFSDDPLLPLERIAVGGVGSVRGYRENHLVRDEGYSLSLEFRYPIIGGNDPSTRHRFTLIPFMDYGEAWNLNGESEALHSAGIGFNWEFRPLYAEFYYGYAINKPRPDFNNDLQDDGLHFQVRLDIL